MVLVDLLYILQIHQGIIATIALIEFPTVPVCNMSMSGNARINIIKYVLVWLCLDNRMKEMN